MTGNSLKGHKPLAEIGGRTDEQPALLTGIL